MHETVVEAKNLSLPHFLYQLIFSDITYLMYTFLKLTTFEKIFFKNTTVRSKRIRNASLYIFFKYSFICPCAFMFLLVL